MEKRITVGEYLRMPETSRPQELDYGVLREPPAPLYGHQAIVTRMTGLLEGFVGRTKLGVVCVSPVDVVLDRERALVVQPDIIFVSAERSHIIGDRVWGAPDLVIEVLSPTTASRDRTRKLAWYREYGVKESWLVDERVGTITVIRLDRGEPPQGRVYRGSQRVFSGLLPGFRPAAARLLGGSARSRVAHQHRGR